jgi:aerobic C4-dicarboxylate transport protein
MALLYFEVVSTLALIVGLVMINLVQPGAGMHIDVNALDTKGIAAYTAPGKMQTTTEFLMAIIPTTIVDAFAKGEILQVLLISVFLVLHCIVSVVAARWFLTLSKNFRTSYSSSLATS